MIGASYLLVAAFVVGLQCPELVAGNSNALGGFTCSPVVCRLNCQFGWAEDYRGCPTCVCRTTNPCAVTTCPVGHSCEIYNQQCSQTPCPLPTRCVPHSGNICGAVCLIFCEFGNEVDANGCEICQCRPDPCAGHTCEAGMECRPSQLNCVTQPCPRRFSPSCRPIPRCHLPRLVGPCRSSIERYYFNPSTSTCDKFTYGGCQGNDNNFATFENCRATCGHRCPPTCRMFCQWGFKTDDHGCEICECNPHPCAAVQCHAGTQCEPVQTACVTTPCPRAFNGVCKSIEDCLLPKVVGNCRAYIPKYFFNSQTLQCERFNYGGCNGNANNFNSFQACKDRCGHHCSPTCAMHCDYGHEVDAHGCKLCQCKPSPCAGYLCAVGTECKVHQINCVAAPCPEEYTASCELKEQCTHAADVGPCRSYSYRYYFNRSTGLCTRFRYGGCQGNSNNFGSFSSCQSTCGHGDPSYNQP